MPNIQKFKQRRVKVKGGEATPIEISQRGINVLRFINWGGHELKVSQASDPEHYPTVMVAGAGGTNNMMDPAGIDRIWCYAAGDIDIGLVELQVEDPMLILAMESVVANLMTSLPAGTAHVGQVGIDIGGAPIGPANRMPVDIGGAVIEAGNLYTQVSALPHEGAPSDSLVVAGTSDGLEPVADGSNVEWIRVVGGKLLVQLEALAAGLEFNVSDRSGREAGKVRLETDNGNLVTRENRLPVEAPGWTTAHIVAAGAETVPVKLAAGHVALILPVAGVGVTLMDGAAAMWPEVTAERDFGSHPVQCNTSIDLAFAGAGEAWVVYR